jgi:spore maturation protein CgeB
MKILAVASVLDVALPFGCTPAWWQLLKALHAAGADVVATPYHGRPVASLWWRVYDNPCYRLGASFAGLRGLARRLPLPKKARPRSAGESAGQKAQRRLVELLVKPRWRRHLFRICEREPDLSAIVILTVPLNHFGGIATAVRERFGVPVVYYDGDVPASLPNFGGFASGFNMYHGADLAEYDAVLCNSQGGQEHLRRLGARRTGVVWWGADPDVFRPVPAKEDIDVFFYGLGTEHRADWLNAMITEPSRRLPGRRFVVAGANLNMDLGRVERIGVIPPAQLNHHTARARLNLNIARTAHASVYASATTRVFELAAMERAIVSNPLEGLHEWFKPGREIEVVHNADQATAAYARLLDDDVRRQSLAEAARQRLLHQHTYGHRAQHLLDFLNRLRDGNREPMAAGVGDTSRE